MDERWHTVTRVRDVRTRLALNELSQRRQTLLRLQTTLEQARSQQLQLERQVAAASDLFAAATQNGNTGSFGAAHAHDLLSYIVSLRHKAADANTPVRRAQLQCDRAQEAVDESVDKYRQEVSRTDAVNTRSQAMLAASRRANLEREDEARADERAGSAIARRSAAAYGVANE